MRVGFDFVEPLGDILEAFPASDIVHDQCSNRSLVVGPGNRLEGFLAGCVPDLDFNHLVADLDVF